MNHREESFWPKLMGIIMAVACLSVLLRLEELTPVAYGLWLILVFFIWLASVS